MKKKILTLAIVFLLFVTAIPSVFSVGEGEWIVRYRVEDLETGQVYVDQDFETGEISEFSPLFDGSELKVTFTVNVELTVSHVNLRISMFPRRSVQLPARHC